jgi:hypothetical protein
LLWVCPSSSSTVGLIGLVYGSNLNASLKIIVDALNYSDNDWRQVQSDVMKLCHFCYHITIYKFPSIAEEQIRIGDKTFLASEVSLLRKLVGRSSSNSLDRGFLKIVVATGGHS